MAVITIDKFKRCIVCKDIDYLLRIPNVLLEFTAKTSGVRRTLLKMHRSGRYAPDAKWIIEGTGNGVNVKGAEAAWRLIREPAATPTDSVM